MQYRQFMSRCSKISGIVPLLVGLVMPRAASAVEPLSVFVKGARETSFDAREQQATLDQRSWEAKAALGRLLPSLSATGIYTHYQYKAVFPPGTLGPGQTEEIALQPQNQWEGIFQLDVPLVDLSQHARYKQAQHLKRASEAQSESIDSNLDRQVAQSYYTYVGASALVLAAEKSLANSEENLAYVRSRVALGVATELDQERAIANVESAKQDLADANLIVVTAGRNLETLSGLRPSKVEAYPEDDLHREGSLEEWITRRDLPSDRVQAELVQASKSAKKAAQYALLPTLSAKAQERVTNATGFTGQAASYTLQGILAWRLDYGTYATAQSQRAAAEIQRIQAERIRRSAEDVIFDAYNRVETGIIKSASARAQAQAATKAANLALERYKVGAVTQLEVTQSQRDAFQAQASRVKADADLALARVLLRAVAGLPIDEVVSASGSVPLVAAPPPEPQTAPAPSPDAAPAPAPQP
jgi:outer membrane protein TolC